MKKNLLEITSIVLAILSLCAATHCVGTEVLIAKMEPLKDAEAEQNSTEFWQQYDLLDVCKKVCIMPREINQLFKFDADGKATWRAEKLKR